MGLKATRSAFDGDRAVYVIQTNARTAGTDLATHAMANELTIVDFQSEIVGDASVNRTGLDVGARAGGND